MIKIKDNHLLKKQMMKIMPLNSDFWKKRGDITIGIIEDIITEVISDKQKIELILGAIENYDPELTKPTKTN